jgi:hypothetical protein
VPVDKSLYHSPAARGDVAGVAINVSMALDQIRIALLSLQAGDHKNNKKSLDGLQDLADKLDQQFDELTGYQSDGGLAIHAWPLGRLCEQKTAWTPRKNPNCPSKAAAEVALQGA